MKINRIDTFLIDAKSRNWLIAKITTDEGITGIGEESFEVTDFKSRNTTTIAYKDVQHIEAKTLSRGGQDRTVDWSWRWPVLLVAILVAAPVDDN